MFIFVLVLLHSTLHISLRFLTQAPELQVVYLKLTHIHPLPSAIVLRQWLPQHKHYLQDGPIHKNSAHVHQIFLWAINCLLIHPSFQLCVMQKYSTSNAQIRRSTILCDTCITSSLVALKGCCVKCHDMSTLVSLCRKPWNLQCISHMPTNIFSRNCCWCYNRMIPCGLASAYMWWLWKRGLFFWHNVRTITLLLSRFKLKIKGEDTNIKAIFIAVIHSLLLTKCHPLQESGPRHKQIALVIVV